MEPQRVELANFTSLRVGGAAERLYRPTTLTELKNILEGTDSVDWMLGFGSNVLISDKGLPGTTVMWRGGDVTYDDTCVTVDAGVWWDDLVSSSIGKNLWGIELMSEIPSSVGGAIYGNIAAYGQQVSDALSWVEVYDSETRQVRTLQKDDIAFSYRSSALQQQPHLIILRAGFQLSQTPTRELAYDSALLIAEELGYDITTLAGRRSAIIETRTRAGSIYHPDDTQAERTAGSFFKNPLVDVDQAKELAAFDETGKTLERIIHQSQIHGGSAQRASAAHVLLAAGYHRGQTWRHVKLHDNHVLKIQTLPGATAQEVYDVSSEIVATVKQKLGITIEPEVKFLGEF